MFLSRSTAAFSLAILLILIICSVPALGQATCAIPVDTQVKLRLLQGIDSGNNKTGEPISFEVYEDVCDSHGYVVIPVGAKASGHIVQSSGAAMFGKNGKLEISIDSVSAIDNTTIPLSMTSVDKPVTKTGTVIASVLISPLGALLGKGVSIRYKEGKPFIAFVAKSDKVISVASSSHADISPPKPDIDIIRKGFRDFLSLKKVSFQVVLRNKGQGIANFYLLAKVVKKGKVLGDGSIDVRDLKPGEERKCRIPMNGLEFSNNDKPEFEIYPTIR